LSLLAWVKISDKKEGQGDEIKMATQNLIFVKMD
jgi:hypothetical protein